MSLPYQAFDTDKETDYAVECPSIAISRVSPNALASVSEDEIAVSAAYQWPRNAASGSFNYADDVNDDHEVAASITVQAPPTVAASDFPSSASSSLAVPREQVAYQYLDQEQNLVPFDEWSERCITPYMMALQPVPVQAPPSPPLAGAALGTPSPLLQLAPRDSKLAADEEETKHFCPSHCSTCSASYQPAACESCSANSIDVDTHTLDAVAIQPRAEADVKHERSECSLAESCDDDAVDESPPLHSSQSMHGTPYFLHSSHHSPLPPRSFSAELLDSAVVRCVPKASARAPPPLVLPESRYVPDAAASCRTSLNRDIPAPSISRPVARSSRSARSLHRSEHVGSHSRSGSSPGAQEPESADSAMSQQQAVWWVGSGVDAEAVRVHSGVEHAGVDAHVTRARKVSLFSPSTAPQDDSGGDGDSDQAGSGGGNSSTRSIAACSDSDHHDGVMARVPSSSRTRKPSRTSSSASVLHGPSTHTTCADGENLRADLEEIVIPAIDNDAEGHTGTFAADPAVPMHDYPQAEAENDGAPTEADLQEGDRLRIDIKVKEVRGLFNSLDPSPFYERGLDEDAEEYIVSWARSDERNREIDIVLHLRTSMEAGFTEEIVQTAIRNHFLERASMSRRQLRSTFREARNVLIIGLLVLTLCVFVNRILYTSDPDPATWLQLLQDGVLVAGWVAFWRPMDMLFYSWFPLLMEKRLDERLSRATVIIAHPPQPPAPIQVSVMHK